MCNKICRRSSMPENNNDDYIKTCISSGSNETNAYNYCAERMKTFDLVLMTACKLDMCNLCCATLGPIKKKNYTFDNTQKCFSACSQSN